MLTGQENGIIIGGIIFIILFFIVLIAIGCKIASSGNQFRDNSQKIKEGMSKEDVYEIMGDPSFIKKHQDGSIELIYEKSEWKGWLRGGTKTRRMEVVISSNNRVISVGKNANCDNSGW